MENVILISGFILATYSVVGNDVIQTLGTFLTSNQKRHRLVLWSYAASLLTIVIVVGWLVNHGDVSYGRLSFIPFHENLQWWYILPPLVKILAQN